MNLCKKNRLSPIFFAELREQGKRFFGRSIRICYKMGELPGPKLGVTVLKKSGPACARNYFKRVVREVFRKEKRHLPPKIMLQILPQNSLKEISYQTIFLDFCQFLQDYAIQS